MSSLLRRAGAVAYPCLPVLPLFIVCPAMDEAFRELLSSTVKSALCSLPVPLFPLFIVCPARHKKSAGSSRDVWRWHGRRACCLPCIPCSSCATQCTRARRVIGAR